MGDRLNGAAGTAETAVELVDLTLGYNRHPAVHHVSATVRKGRMVAVVGPNGAGKSTLLKGIVGSLRPIGGRIALNGYARHEIGYLPQLSEVDRSFPITVRELVAFGLWGRLGMLGDMGACAPQVARAIDAVGLAGFERRQIGTLSGGQFQRALFARLLLQDARLFLLDEPLSEVDPDVAGRLLEIILGWHGEGRTILASMHNLALVAEHFPETMVLARELVAFGPTATTLGPALSKANVRNEAFDEHASVCPR